MQFDCTSDSPSIHSGELVENESQLIRIVIDTGLQLDVPTGWTQASRRSHHCGIRGLLLASLLLVPVGVGAQQRPPRGSLDGRVLDERGEPLAGVRVELVELGLATRTDEGGAYRIPDLLDGRYTLRFGGLDRGVTERYVSVEGGAVTVPAVRLVIVALPLEPLQVIEQRTRLAGVRARVPGSAQVLDAEQLEAAVTPYDDIHQLLRRVPGVNVQEEDGYGLRPNIGMRGSGSERSSKITLMEDGVLIAPAPYSAPSAYYFPVVGRMQAIEVRKGSSQIKYGPRTIGGALNLVSSSIPTESFRWAGEVMGGPDATRRVHARIGGSSDRLGWLAETYQIATDGFKQLPTGGSSGFGVQDYLAKVRWNSDPAAADFYQQVEVKLGYYDERSNETYLGLTESDFRASPLERYAASQQDVMNADHRQLQVRHFLRAGRDVDLTTTAYRNEFSRNWYKLQSVRGSTLADVLDAPDAFAQEIGILRGSDSPDADLRVRANNRDYYAEGIQSVLAARIQTFGLNHELEIGARYHRDAEDRFQHEDGFRMASGTMSLEEPGEPGSQSNRIGEARAWAFYIEDRVEFGRLALTPGARLETVDFRRIDYSTDDPGRAAPVRVRTNGVTALLPGVGATLGFGSDGRVFAGVHRGFGPPGPGADDDTVPEESVNYEIGIGLGAADAAAQLVGFYNDYDNVLGTATLASGTDGTGQLFNGGAADIWGLEASASLDLAPASAGVRLPVLLAYTFTHARFRTSFESEFDAWGAVQAGDEMPYLSRHQLFGSIGAAGESWRLGIEVTAASAMRTSAGRGVIPDGSGTEAHATLGVKGEYRMAKWGALFAGVQNLTDARFIVARRPAGTRPGLPRTIEAGIRLEH